MMSKISILGFLPYSNPNCGGRRIVKKVKKYVNLLKNNSLYNAINDLKFFGFLQKSFPF